MVVTAVLLTITVAVAVASLMFRKDNGTSVKRPPSRAPHTFTYEDLPRVCSSPGPGPQAAVDGTPAYDPAAPQGTVQAILRNAPGRDPELVGYRCLLAGEEQPIGAPGSTLPTTTSPPLTIGP
jgi:hypothetical protein